MPIYTPEFRRRLSRRQRRDEGRLRLLPIGWALTICFAAAALGLGGLSWIALALLHHPKLPAASSISLHDLISVLQLVFASVAGAGALVALVMTYRRQRVAEVATAHDRIRVLNERFTAIAAQLGDDNPAVRLAGIHAMAGLADDWAENQQTCVDVLCAYLRLPDEPDPGDDAPAEVRLAFRANQQVRHTAVRVISAHLRPYAVTSWRGLDLDFAGAQFDGGDFGGVVFSGGTVNFAGARFSGEVVDFRGAVFSGARVSFARARFCGDVVDFSDTEFSRGYVDFSGAEFAAKTVYFTGAKFQGGTVNFDYAQYPGGSVEFVCAEFSWSAVSFQSAGFSGGTVDFLGALFSGSTVDFAGARFSCGVLSFARAEFSSGEINFGGVRGAWFSGCELKFQGARFCGARVLFDHARFSGGTVSFAGAEFSDGTVRFDGAKLSDNTPSFEDAHFSGNIVSFDEAEFSDSADDLTEDSGWSTPPWFDYQRIPSKPHFNIIITDDPDSAEPRRRWRAATQRRKGSAPAPSPGPENPPDTAQSEAD